MPRLMAFYFEIVHQPKKYRVAAYAISEVSLKASKMREQNVDVDFDGTAYFIVEQTSERNTAFTLNADKTDLLHATEKMKMRLETMCGLQNLMDVLKKHEKVAINENELLCISTNTDRSI